MATSSLMFCMTCRDGLDLVLGAAGAAGFDFSEGEGRIYTWLSEGTTGSGLFLGWAMALGSKSMGFR